MQNTRLIVKKGSASSGNYGHAGRPGQVGGSAKGTSNLPAGKAPGTLFDESTMQNINNRFAAERTAKNIITQGAKRLSNATDEDLFITNDDIRGKVKESICKDIAARAGVSQEDVDNILESWASSCQSAQSIAFQKAVSDELGVPLSKAQEQKLKDYTVGIDSFWHLNNDFPESALELFTDDGMAKQRKIARAMYESTQELLKDAPDYIMLSRGMRSDKILGDQVTFEALQDGTNVKYKGNSVESWSASWDSATDFTGHNGGIVLTMMVPKKAIFSTCLTGLGCLPEYEFGVLGSIPGHEAYVESFYDPYPELE
jgi:hypothetical protein